MTLYIVEIIIVLILGVVLHKTILLTNGKTIKGKDVYLFSAFLLLWIIMAFRGPSVGTDTFVYNGISQKIASSKSYVEALKVSTISSAPFYVLYSYLLSKIFSGDQMIIIVNSTIICVGFLNFIKKVSRNYLFSTFLFIALTMYFESMNGMRQFVAIALALNAFVVLKQNVKDVRSWILLAISFLIHNTIAILLVGIIGAFLIKKNTNVNNVFLKSVLISLIFSLGFRFSISLITNIIPYFKQYINGENSAQMFNNSGTGRIIILYFIFLIVLIIYDAIWKRNHRCCIRSDLSIYPSVIFCAITGIVFSKNILFNRLLWIYVCMYAVFIPNTYQLIYKKSTRRLITICTCVLLLVYCTFHLMEDKSGIIPYVVFFDY